MELNHDIQSWQSQVSFRVTYPPGFETWRKDELADFKSTRYGKILFRSVLFDFITGIALSLVVIQHNVLAHTALNVLEQGGTLSQGALQNVLLQTLL